MLAPLDRRTLLTYAALAPFARGRRAGEEWRPARDEPDLTEPDLTEARILRNIAGLRPHRQAGIRVEAERLGDKFVVHNYGHGGAGVTLSWGSAEEAVTLLAATVAAPADVAVLGAGAVGLASARVLQERGYRVRVLAEDFPPNTTSDVAGAEWLPIGVSRGDDDDARQRFERIVRTSWQRFRALLGDEYGVYERPHFEVGNSERLLADVPGDVIPAARALPKLPFARIKRRGERFDTLLVEPPIYLTQMMRQVLRGGGKLQARTFASASDVTSLAESAIVNCLGLGAGRVFGDDSVRAVRGQLVHAFPQQLPYLLSHEGGTLLPRRDCIVLGGTYEMGIDDPTPDARMCAEIVAGHRRFFGGI
ncbi:MAG: FAD-dependent oxidoreductase [Planctomycetota bacterium]